MTHHPATITTANTETHTHVHIVLDEAASYEVRPGVSDPINRVMVNLTTINGEEQPPTLQAATRWGRYIFAGVGVGSVDRDDSLLIEFADLIRQARDHVARQAAKAQHPAYDLRPLDGDGKSHDAFTVRDLPVRWDNSLDEIGEGAHVSRVVHAGTTRYEPAPTDPRGPLGPLATSLEPTHTCQHGDQVWPCSCDRIGNHSSLGCPFPLEHKA